MRHATLIVAVVALALAAPAFSGKGGNGNGNGDSEGSYTGSLTATPDVLHAGEPFTVAGCGYDPDDGNVVVRFTGGSWGSALDSNGCFTISDIPALSGDTLPAGVYDVTAYQYGRNGKLRSSGETHVTVVP